MKRSPDPIQLSGLTKCENEYLTTLEPQTENGRGAGILKMILNIYSGLLYDMKQRRGSVSPFSRNLFELCFCIGTFGSFYKYLVTKVCNPCKCPKILRQTAIVYEHIELSKGRISGGGSNNSGEEQQQQQSTVGAITSNISGSSSRSCFNCCHSIAARSGAVKIWCLSQLVCMGFNDMAYVFGEWFAPVLPTIQLSGWWLR